MSVAQVERSAAARAVVLVAPHRVPLAVVRAVHEDHGLEPGLAVGEPQALVLPEALRGRHVAVVRAVDEQVVHVLERRELAGRLVLAVHRRDRDDRLDVEVELEFLLEVVGVVLELVERRRDRRRFAAARMAHDRDAVHVHLALIERAVGRVVELLPRLEMLQQQPRAPVVLRAQAVDEVLIDRRQDESARGQQLAQIARSPGSENSCQLWLPCTMSASGNGPGAVRDTRRAPLIGAFLRSKPQNFFRVFACGAGIEANGDTSTVFVLIVTSLPNSGRLLVRARAVEQRTSR